MVQLEDLNNFVKIDFNRFIYRMCWFFFIYFFILIFFIKCFNLENYKIINHQILYVIFIIKICLGIPFNIIYLKYYQDRKTVDTYKIFLRQQVALILIVFTFIKRRIKLANLNVLLFNKFLNNVIFSYRINNSSN